MVDGRSSKSFKQISSVDWKKRREEFFTAARHRRKEHHVLQKRNSMSFIESQILFSEQLGAVELERQLEGAMGFRKLLSTGDLVPVGDIVCLGIIPKFIELLRSDCKELQMEAAWAITNIAFGTSEHCRALVDNGVVPRLLSILSLTAPKELIEQALWALGNIAGDSLYCRMSIIGQNGIETFVAFIRQCHVTVLVNSAVWAISNCCRGLPDEYYSPVVLPILRDLLSHPDERIAADAAWGIAYYAEGSCNRVQAILNENLLTDAQSLLSSGSAILQVAALRLIGNIIAGEPQSISFVIDSPILISLRNLLHHQDKLTRMECCHVLETLTMDASSLGPLFDSAVVSAFINILATSSEFEMKDRGSVILWNICRNASAKVVMEMINSGIQFALIELLHMRDYGILLATLESLRCIARVVAAVSFPQLFAECGGFEILYSLQTHENNAISDCVNDILSILHDEDGVTFIDESSVDDSPAKMYWPPSIFD